MPDIPNRDELERKIARLLGRFNRKQLIELLEKMGNSPNMTKIPPSYWKESEQALATELIPFSEDVYLQAAQRVMESVPVGVDWTLINQAAADWSVREVGRLVKEITETTRKRVGEAVSSYFTEAQTIGDLEKRLSRMKDRFGNIFGPKRAEGIAVTEITRAAAEGEYQIAKGLREQGVDMIARWITNNDEIVRECPICWPLHKRKADGIDVLGNPYWVHPNNGNRYQHPAHIRCRCWPSHELPVMA